MEMETPTPPEDVARLRAAIERAEPPGALKARVGRQLAQARERRARCRATEVGALAAVAALATAVVLLVQPRGSSPTVVEVGRVAAAVPRAPAPPLDAAHPYRLAAHVGGVWFPNWRLLRWRPVGRSSQAIAGRRAATVYYVRDDGARLAYTIVAAKGLGWPADTRKVVRGWTRFRVYSDAERRVIGWRRLGHECLLAAPRSLSQGALLALAAGEG